MLPESKVFVSRDKLNFVSAVGWWSIYACISSKFNAKMCASVYDATYHQSTIKALFAFGNLHAWKVFTVVNIVFTAIVFTVATAKFI